MSTVDATPWMPAAAGAGVLVAGAWARGRWAVAVRRPGPVAPGGRRRRPTRTRIVAFAVVSLVMLSTLGWIGPLSGAAIAFAVRHARPLLAERRRRRSAVQAMPDAVERFVLLVHAGLSPHLAVRAAADAVPTPLQPAFDAVVHRLDRGAPLADAVGALPEVLGPRAAPLADAIGVAERYGLPLEPMLDQLARDARHERRRLDEAAARRLPVRLAFPLVTCTLPSFVLVAIAPAVIAALSSLGTSW